MAVRMAEIAVDAFRIRIYILPALRMLISGVDLVDSTRWRIERTDAFANIEADRAVGSPARMRRLPLLTSAVQSPRKQCTSPAPLGRHCFRAFSFLN